MRGGEAPNWRRRTRPEFPVNTVGLYMRSKIKETIWAGRSRLMCIAAKPNSSYCAGSSALRLPWRARAPADDASVFAFGPLKDALTAAGASSSGT